ncbi:nitrate/nitrite transporter NrtS [Reinekea thalattae]|uniref:Phosphoenolpyruvate protein kinase n=1 Tax=Reinekea thalattae TaxID=2593301 RepID=A0A5C8Z8E2_9GAMM|nr:nitrate/nitrite transporter NrtS [Reinekea thalattae]TXR54385.1 hypothetical protein FME95_07560 [Reinekea thalattae]
MTPQKDLSFFAIAFSPEVRRTAIRVALIVGSALALINHGDKLVTGTLTVPAILKMLLTYLVPYSVSTWSAVKAIRACDGDSSHSQLGS